MVHSTDDAATRKDRSALAAVLLGLIMAGGVLAFFYLASPFFFWIMLATVGGLTAYGGLHYLLWGKAMLKETEEERAALREAEQAAAAVAQQQLPHQRRY